MLSQLTIVTPIRAGRAFPDLRTHEQRLTQLLRALQERALDGLPIPPDLIRTIHFAHWSVLKLPGAQPQLVFSAVFDGDARQYLRDFALLIPAAIDGVWENCDGYPSSGCADFEAFWDYAQRHFVEPLTFYGSYSASVDDIGQLREHWRRSEATAGAQ